MGTSASTDNNSASSPRNVDPDFEQVEDIKDRALDSSEELKSDELVMNDMSKSTVLVDKPRRIVKATPPTPTSETTASASGAAASAATETKETTDAEDDDEEKETKHHHTVGITTDEELLQESIDQSHSKRMQQLAQKQKSDRQHEIEERRKHPEKQRGGAVAANPFSRFLSAFSVENEHKRKEEPASGEEEGLPPKKQRPNEEDEPVSNDQDYWTLILGKIWPADDDNDKNPGDWPASYTRMATATAVVAVAVLLVANYSKRKH